MTSESLMLGLAWILELKRKWVRQSFESKLYLKLAPKIQKYHFIIFFLLLFLKQRIEFWCPLNVHASIVPLFLLVNHFFLTHFLSSSTLSRFLGVEFGDVLLLFQFSYSLFCIQSLIWNASICFISVFSALNFFFFFAIMYYLLCTFEYLTHANLLRYNRKSYVWDLIFSHVRLEEKPFSRAYSTYSKLGLFSILLNTNPPLPCPHDFRLSAVNILVYC